MAMTMTTVQARERLQQRIAELDRLKAATSGSGAAGGEEVGVDATITCKVRVPCSVYHACTTRMPCLCRAYTVHML